MRLGGGRMGRGDALGASYLGRTVLSQVIARSYVEYSNLAVLLASVYTNM